MKHKGQLHTGVNEPLILANIFDTDQGCLAKNSGRKSKTGKGLPACKIRCAHCVLTMWAQSHNNGNHYYRAWTLRAVTSLR